MAKYQTLKTKIYLIPCYMKFLISKFDTSPFDSIWLEISSNWHTKSQGPMKKCSNFTKRRIHPCPVHTACNQGSSNSQIAFCSILFSPSSVYYLKFLPVICATHCTQSMSVRRWCAPGTRAWPAWWHNRTGTAHYGHTLGLRSASFWRRGGGFSIIFRTSGGSSVFVKGWYRRFHTSLQLDMPF